MSGLGTCNCTITTPGPSVANACGGTAFVLFMGLLEHFIRTQCDIEDPCGRVDSQTSPHREYDFIVVGGGSAGSVVASRLSEIPEWKVLLVEAGTNEPTGSQVPSMWVNFLGSSIDWKYKTEPEEMACLAKPEQRCYWPRGKVIGGTSVINGLMYMRGSRKDYDNWEKLGNPGWAYKDVLPYFLKAENNLQIDEMDKGYHSVGGPLPVTQFPHHPPLAEAILEGAKELGQRVGDLNGEKHEGFAIAQSTSKNGSRYSAARSYLRPVKSRSNLHIMLETTVARVLVDPDTKKAYGVEIIRNGGKKDKILAKKEVVVSSGAVGSPQVLLLSGIGPREDLEKVNVTVVLDRRGVGRFLRNHVGVAVSFVLNDNATADLNWATAMQYMLHRDGMMTSTGLSQLTGLIKTKFANALEDHPDIQIFFGGYLANCAKTGEVGEISDKTANGDPKKRIISMVPTALHPKSFGYLKLRDNNPLSPPKIVARYLTEPGDLETVIEGVKFCLKLAKTDALKKYGLKLDTAHDDGCKNHTFGSDDYWGCVIRRNTAPENHQGGSCHMGPASDLNSVVNAELQVHGIKYLRVIDTSVMPRITSGNTNAPAIMIGEKGSDMIKKKWLKL